MQEQEKKANFDLEKVFPFNKATATALLKDGNIQGDYCYASPKTAIHCLKLGDKEQAHFLQHPPRHGVKKVLHSANGPLYGFSAHELRVATGQLTENDEVYNHKLFLKEIRHEGNLKPMNRGNNKQ